MNPVEEIPVLMDRIVRAEHERDHWLATGTRAELQAANVVLARLESALDERLR